MIGVVSSFLMKFTKYLCCSVLFLPRTAVKALHRIFQVRLGRHLQSHDFVQDIREMYKELVFATLSVFFAITATLLPTPAKSHYTFNVKDVNKVRSFET